MSKAYEDQIVLMIKKIVDDHSGGIKFTELLTELAIAVHEESAVDNNCSINISPDEIETIIRKMDDIQILDYTYQDLRRAKMFIYTP